MLKEKWTKVNGLKNRKGL